LRFFIASNEFGVPDDLDDGEVECFDDQAVYGGGPSRHGDMLLMMVAAEVGLVIFFCIRWSK
jgi:hypothetical protein